VAPVQPTELSTILASFTGYFKYGAGTQNQCSVDAMGTQHVQIGEQPVDADAAMSGTTTSSPRR
jgi:hypothetical protein